MQHETGTADLQAMFKTIITRLDTIDEILESPSLYPFKPVPLSDEAKLKLDKEYEERQAKAQSLEEQHKMQMMATLALVERVVVALEKIGSAAETLAEAARSIEKYGVVKCH